MKFKVIGAGLAGVEAAWQIANNGYNVSLYEMKPIKKSEAHKSDLFCELVCSNSLKASRIESAAGLLNLSTDPLQQLLLYRRQVLNPQLFH